MNESDLTPLVVERYAEADWRTRWHVRGRLRSCPFLALLPHLPSSGLMASLGCGHGVFEILAALARPDLEVIGADLDPAKIEHGQRAVRYGPALNVDLQRGDLLPLLEARAKRPDVVVITDVLYLIEKSDQFRLLRQIHERLAPNGRIVLKEMGTRPRWKVRWNAFQETVACRVLRWTHAPGAILQFPTESEWLAQLADVGFRSVSLFPLDRGYLHPHLLITAERGKDE